MAATNGEKPPTGAGGWVFLDRSKWSPTASSAWDYAIGCHLGHRSTATTVPPPVLRRSDQRYRCACSTLPLPLPLPLPPPPPPPPPPRPPPPPPSPPPSPHSVEMLVALVFYNLAWPHIFPEAATWQAGWVLKVVAFNLTCMLVFTGGWHWFTYCRNYDGLLTIKFNAKNQYEPDGGPVRMFRSSSGQLEREIKFQTLGWLQVGRR
jgi:hypothetical protein